MKRLVLAGLLGLAGAASPIAAQQPAFDARHALDEAISQVRQMAFRTRQVDWPDLEARVRAAGANARDQIDLLPAYEMLVEGLGDGHSLINVSPEDRAEFKARQGREFDSARVYKQPTSTFTNRRQPEARTLAVGGRSAELIVVPKVFGGGDPARAYSAELGKLVGAAAPRSCGYVVDLRGNLGGNVWPMTVGVGALLGEGWQSYEIDRDGKRSPYVRLEQGAAVIVSGEQAGLTIIAPDAWQPLPALAGVPVAVLIDDAVASSGEGMAVAFRGRANTRFFGQRTYGSASSNEGFVLDDRVNIVVTTAMMSDRTGAIYPDGVPPDDEVAFGPGDAADPDDAVVEAAKAWLGAQPACR
jgi:hypothetical protein